MKGVFIRTAALAAVALAIGGCAPAMGVAGAGCALCDIAGKSAPTDTITARGVDAVGLAATLAEHGRRANSAIALLAAAELLANTSPARLEATKSVQGAAGPQGTKAGPTVTLDAAQLISAARAIDAGAQISALATQLENRISSGPKGAIGGPRYLVDRVSARTTDIWTVAFRGGERASIRVRGDGDTDLDCYVYDTNGRLVAYDNDYTDYCILDWYPSFSNTHRLEIRNLGDVYNEYVLTTN